MGVEGITTVGSVGMLTGVSTSTFGAGEETSVMTKGFSNGTTGSITVEVVVEIAVETSGIIIGVDVPVFSTGVVLAKELFITGIVKIFEEDELFVCEVWAWTWEVWISEHTPRVEIGTPLSPTVRQ